MRTSYICETQHQIAKKQTTIFSIKFPGSRRKNDRLFNAKFVGSFVFFRWFWERQRCDGMYQLGIKGFGLQQCTSPCWKLEIGDTGSLLSGSDVKKNRKTNRDHEILKWDRIYFWGNQTWFLKGHWKFLERFWFGFLLGTRCLKQSFVVFYPGTLFSSSIILEFSWFTWYAWSFFFCILFMVVGG